MRDRFDRTLPWGILLGILIAMLLGVSWDASFEAQPANTDLASEGDDRIRELKVEIADRGEDELCWGTGLTTGCPGAGDNGFAREGSARGFFATAAPTTLNDAATTALGAGHDGRFWVDNDGPDNIDANNDDNRVSFWNGSAFETFRWEALSGIVLTGIANGDILRYNGTNLVNTALNTLHYEDGTSFASGETFTNGACAVDCTVADVPDHTNGSDSVGNYPEIELPTTAGVTWNVYVTGQVLYQMTSSNNGYVVCEVETDTNDAETWGTTVVVDSIRVANGNGDVRICHINAMVCNTCAAGGDIAVRVKMTDPDGTADWDVEAAGLPALVAGKSFLRITARPNSIF